MRKSLIASLMAVTAVATIPTQADARRHYNREYRGDSYRCHRQSGTTGTIVGGVAGGLLGHALVGGTGGTLVGAGAGALGGRALTRNKVKCKYR